MPLWHLSLPNRLVGKTLADVLICSNICRGDDMVSNLLNIALDPHLKDQSSKLYKDLGMSLSTAVKVFLRQSVVDQGMPFQPRLSPEPTKSTREAMKETDNSSNYKAYSDEGAMWKDILK